MPKLALRALGVVNPMMRELAEMSYEFDQAFVLDSSKYQSTFGTAGTPLPAAVLATVTWYRNRIGASGAANPGSGSSPRAAAGIS